MTTPHQPARRGRTASFGSSLTHRAWRAAAAAALLALLTACGGGGGAAPEPTAQARTLVGPTQAVDLTDTCLNNPGREGDAQHACYGVGYDSRDELQLRSDRMGGLLIKTLANPFSTSARFSGKLARISPTGTRTTLAMPAFNGPFDVASDGTVWMLHTDESAMAGEVRTLDAQGNTRTAWRFSGGDASPVEGPLGDALPGTYTHIAAGRDSVFLWQDGNSTRPVLRLRRDSAGTWQLKTLALPPGGSGTLRFLGDAEDRLWLLVDDPYRRPAGEPSYAYQSAIELWRWSGDGGWQYRGGRDYTTWAYYKGNTRDLLVTDFSLRPDGGALLSGGYTGSLYAIDAQGQWQVLMQRQGKPLRMLQQQGEAAQIPVDGVFGATTRPDGRVAFIDPMANRIQLFDGSRLSVLSGESWSALSAWERLADARLLGFFPDGRLLLYPRKKWANVDPGAVGLRPESGAFELLEDLDRNRGDLDHCSGLNGMEYYLGCQRVRSSSPRGSTGDSRRGSLVTLSQEPSPRMLRVHGNSVEWLGSSARGTLTANPGPSDGDLDIAATDADTRHLYKIGARSYSGQDFSASGNVYRLPLSGGTWEVVAASSVNGAAVPSSQAYGRTVDISTVRDARHLAVRADGGLWLANDSQLWLISKTGELRLLAGRARPGAATPEAAVDSPDGAAVRFGQIERVRALPDGRALVVDSAGHAVRVVTEQGQTATLVGTLNQSGPATTALPGRLNQPVDALAAAGVLYINEKNNPQMSRVSGVLP